MQEEDDFDVDALVADAEEFEAERLGGVLPSNPHSSSSTSTSLPNRQQQPKQDGCSDTAAGRQLLCAICMLFSLLCYSIVYYACREKSGYYALDNCV